MLFERQKKLSREGHKILRDWVSTQDGRFFVPKATATSIAFVGYSAALPSEELADYIRRQTSVLVAPGSYLGQDGYLRITVGYEPEKVRTALSRIGDVVAQFSAASAMGYGRR